MVRWLCVRIAKPVEQRYIRQTPTQGLDVEEEKAIRGIRDARVDVDRLSLELVGECDEGHESIDGAVEEMVPRPPLGVVTVDVEPGIITLLVDLAEAVVQRCCRFQ